jgi:hypothetical protein
MLQGTLEASLFGAVMNNAEAIFDGVGHYSDIQNFLGRQEDIFLDFKRISSSTLNREIRTGVLPVGYQTTRRICLARHVRFCTSERRSRVGRGSKKGEKRH